MQTERRKKLFHLERFCGGFMMSKSASYLGLCRLFILISYEELLKQKLLKNQMSIIL